MTSQQPDGVTQQRAWLDQERRRATIIPIQTRRETPELQTWTDAHQARADRALQPRHPEEK